MLPQLHKYTIKVIKLINYSYVAMCCRIRSDHNIDNSSAIVERWLAEVKHLYHNVDYKSSQENQGIMTY